MNKFWCKVTWIYWMYIVVVGSAINDGIAYVLMFVVLALTYFICPLDAFPYNLFWGSSDLFLNKKKTKGCLYYTWNHEHWVYIRWRCRASQIWEIIFGYYDWYKYVMILFLLDVFMGIYALMKLWMTNITCGIKTDMFWGLTLVLQERDTSNPNQISTSRPSRHRALHIMTVPYHIPKHLGYQMTEHPLFIHFPDIFYGAPTRFVHFWSTHDTFLQLIKSDLIEEMTWDELDPSMDTFLLHLQLLVPIKLGI